MRWAAGLFPRISIAASDPAAGEAGPDHGSITISRTGDTSEPLPQVFFVAAGTAASGVDYASLTIDPNTLTGVVAFAAQQPSRVLPVTVLPDSAGEGTEIASFTVKPDWRYEASPTQSRATVLIVDDADAHPARGALLFVVGSTALDSGDAAVLGHLQARGYTVTVKAGAAAALADGLNKDATLISSTVDTAALGSRFRDAPYPVMVWESSLWDDMGLVPATGGSFGTSTGQTSLRVVEPDQPAASGLLGLVAAASPADTFRWGKPNEDAITIATLAGDATRASIFGYDVGVVMSGGFPANARRVGFFLGDATAVRLTPTGWMLFDAAVTWTIGKVHEEPLPPFLTTPAPDHLWRMPVVVVRYIPTDDGVNVVSNLIGADQKVVAMRERIARADIHVKFALEEGSRFRGYRNPAARPSLGYEVLKTFTIYEPMPVSNFAAPSGGGRYRPDYASTLARIGGRDFVEAMGVKELWVWGYHYGKIEPTESNMSSALTGDISNGERADDLPIYGSSYVVYGYNHGSGMENAVHNHGHQLELILTHINNTRDLPISNQNLFWQKFVGLGDSGQRIVGRCGWTHSPPNTLVEYDYASPALVESDIEDWTPAGTGQKKLVNASTWRDLTYAWPGGVLPDDLVSANFYIYWMQAHPGRDNGIRYPEADSPQHGQATLNNWWSFTGDWDGRATTGPGLVAHTPP